LPHRAAAWDAATRYAGDSLRDLDGALRLNEDWRLLVLAEDQTGLFQIIIRATDFSRQEKS
jgi:Domain of unknown function (DUF6894)